MRSRSKRGRPNGDQQRRSNGTHAGNLLKKSTRRVFPAFRYQFPPGLSQRLQSIELLVEQLGPKAHADSR
jgi:hypothetical protein